MSFVEFKEITKTYTMGSVKVNAVHDMNFSIEEGELCVILRDTFANFKDFCLTVWRALKMLTFTCSSLISSISAISLYDFPSKSLSCMQLRCFSGRASTICEIASRTIEYTTSTTSCFIGKADKCTYSIEDVDH